MSRCRSARTLRASVSVAMVGLLSVAGQPAVAQEPPADTGTITAEVTIAEAPDEVCVLLEVDALDLGVLDFGASATSAPYTVTSCSTGEQELLALASDAVTGEGGPSWTLVDGAGPRASDQFSVDARLRDIGTARLTTSSRVVGTLAGEQAASATHELLMPPAGSAGAGQTFTFDVVWTATLAASEPAWRLQDAGSGTGRRFEDVDFVDARTGWAVGEAGTILATVDAGASWNQQSTPTVEQLTGVSFADAQHGWAVGMNGTILATVDAGVTWTQQASPFSQRFTAVAFVDTQRGWAVGQAGTILATADGGETWVQQQLPENLPYVATPKLEGVSFLDAQTGWVVGDFGTILATTNGGVTWTEQEPPNNAGLEGVSFVDAQTGWVVAYGYIHATTNGGTTWTPQPVDYSIPTGFNDVSFVDTQTGWIAGLDGTILVTTDGGASWAPQASAGQWDQVRAVSAISKTRVWAVGYPPGPGRDVSPIQAYR
jgi:photosystem II stability/assembly factor-like uncharacterized protein